MHNGEAPMSTLKNRWLSLSFLHEPDGNNKACVEKGNVVNGALLRLTRSDPLITFLKKWHLTTTSNHLYVQYISIVDKANNFKNFLAVKLRQIFAKFFAQF
jgi:hypothetical protein